MPVLRKRKGSKTHPRQTDYYLLARPPEVGNITYQIDTRAKDFLTSELGYGDEDDIPWSLVHPLRVIRDLFTLDEGHPRNASPEPDFEPEPVSLHLHGAHKQQLVEYLSAHPDVSADITELKRRIERDDPDFLDIVEREGYTPSQPPGFDETGNETLDRIANQFFASTDHSDSITWDGHEVSDYIVVEDRDGEAHRFPRIPNRFPEGERYRFSESLYRRWGPGIGNSVVISKRYEPDEDGFPNRWIGQRQEAPEPSLEDAESPRAFYYRSLAGRSGYAPGQRAKEEFEAVCDYSLEVYQANFPTAVDPETLSEEYVTIEAGTKPWEDFQIPPGWLEEYENTGGEPPLVRGIPGYTPGELSEEEQAFVRKRGPNGDQSEAWFNSMQEAVEVVRSEVYEPLLNVLEALDLNIQQFRLNGIALPLVTIDFGEATGELLIDEGVVNMDLNTETAEYHIGLKNGKVQSWEVVEGDISTHQRLKEVDTYFDDIAELATLLT